MLSDARPLFEGLPASYADPLALAAQQAPGTSSIIVVSYPGDAVAAHADPSRVTLHCSPIYDVYACRGGSIVSVARTTADFRFPIMPAAALRRFVEARDQGVGAQGGAVRVSLYEVTDGLLRRWLETVYLAPCLKVHVRGAGDAPLVAAQLEASACRSGVLEVNDFSDALRPRVKLLHVESVPQAGFLAAQLSLQHGRVLLYDRARNAAIAPSRAGMALDLGAALDQAGRLAEARRPVLSKAARAAERQHARRMAAVAEVGDERHLQHYFTETDARPRRVATEHPSAQALGDLLASDEMASTEGAAHDALALLLGAWDAEDAGEAVGDAGVEADAGGQAGVDVDVDVVVSQQASAHEANAKSPHGTGDDDTPVDLASTPEGPADQTDVSPPLPASAPPPNLPASPQSSAPTRPSSADEDLGQLVASVRERLHDAIGAEREDALARHAAASADTSLPSPAARTADFLRAYLTGDPPKRWYGFKGQRKRLYAPIADDVRALFEAHRHSHHTAIEALPALWARLQR